MKIFCYINILCCLTERKCILFLVFPVFTAAAEELQQNRLDVKKTDDHKMEEETDDRRRGRKDII
ncbi:hypothetical protein EXN66_Car014151 [Channa argus]|uniref:Uncharacterized protein n=1 Tax=Channa argus TaxID=215402 RepID=A0A6G1Q752_CHAAH|nr:hypothetical protein EXN66_Car014151 [Channa argus]